jgi:hypothetical protein
VNLVNLGGGEGGGAGGGAGGRPSGSVLHRVGSQQERKIIDLHRSSASVLVLDLMVSATRVGLGTAPKLQCLTKTLGLNHRSKWGGGGQALLFRLG